MGLISRHSNAPFSDGETLSGTELEQDFATAFDEFNGNITNINIKSSAAISGTKLANTSITDSKILSDTLTTSKMAASAVTKHHVSINASYGNITISQASLIDWTSITGATLTPGSTSDMIMMDLTFHYDAASSDASNDLVVGWRVDSTDYDNIVLSTPTSGNNEVVVHSSYSVVAPGTSSIVIKPRHRYNGTETLAVGHVIFRCFILPGK